MEVQNKIIQHYNGKKIANQLKKSNLSSVERDKLLIELEKSGAGYAGVLHHNDVKFDTEIDSENMAFDENMRNFDYLYNVHVKSDTILPTGAIVVGGRKVFVDNDDEKESCDSKEMLNLKKNNTPSANALIAYVYKKDAPFSECLLTSANYYTQNQCTLTQCLGAKVVRHSEVDTENFEFEFGDAFEVAYVRFSNAYYRAMRLLEIVERHQHEKLTPDEKTQLKSIYDSARIMYNRALFNLLDECDCIGSTQLNKLKYEIVRDSKKLKLKLHINKWKNAVNSINSVKMFDYPNYCI